MSPILRSQSLSGWDGVFHRTKGAKMQKGPKSRNPFQGGMGFFTQCGVKGRGGDLCRRNPFQGGMGFFT